MADIVKIKVTGFKELAESLRKDVPKGLREVVLQRGMRAAARPTMVKIAKSKARREKSDSLSIAIGTWPMLSPLSNTQARVGMGPIRSNRRAIRAYFAYYYGRPPTPKEFKRGIRHGHFVEWGTSRNTTKAVPFLRPAVDSGFQPYMFLLGKTIAAAILRAARKRSRIPFSQGR